MLQSAAPTDGSFIQVEIKLSSNDPEGPLLDLLSS